MFYRRLIFWTLAIALISGSFASWKSWSWLQQHFQFLQPKNTRITVYQSTGKAGEVAFSDRPKDGSPRVVDTRQGTTYASTSQGQVPQTASVTDDAPNPHHPILDPVQHLRHENFKNQHKMAEARDQQIMNATGQTH